MSAKSARVKKLALLAMFTAIGAVLITLVHFPLFPAAPFLQYDPADVPILIAAFAFGPVAGILVTVLASVYSGFLFGRRWYIRIFNACYCHRYSGHRSQYTLPEVSYQNRCDNRFAAGHICYGRGHDDRQPFHYSILYGGPH